jgi:hypothetical protein
MLVFAVSLCLAWTECPAVMFAFRIELCCFICNKLDDSQLDVLVYKLCVE